MSITFETVIGLEVHVQLRTQTKIFCRCATAFGAAANSQVCPVCMGLPGALPVLNREAVEYAIKMGLATHCSIANKSVFARKNYFYPDLPKGYQISQYELPLCLKGWVDVDLNDGKTKRIGITRIHMEEDAGKNIHAGRGTSLVDYNRSSMPLLEIVSEPDMRSSAEAGAYMRAIHSIIRYLDVSDGNMEEGSLRCDANVSIRPQGEAKFGTKVELKNLNSFKFVEKAIDYEVERQREAILSNEPIVQETRLYDADTNTTHSMRGKESAHDYRYFPDPDLLPLIVSDEWIAAVKAKLPELARDKRERFVRDFDLPVYDADVLTQDAAVAAYFESVVEHLQDRKTAKLASNWVMGEVMRVLKETKSEVRDFAIKPKALAELIELIASQKISGSMGKTVFAKMLEGGRSAGDIVKAEGLEQVSDTGALEALVQKVIADNPKQLEQYKAGKVNLFGFFVGQVMKAAQGKANPQVVNDILKKHLS